jgi:hypothetical protein
MLRVGQYQLPTTILLQLHLGLFRHFFPDRDVLLDEIGRRIRRIDIAPLIDAVWALNNSADVSKLASLAVPR